MCQFYAPSNSECIDSVTLVSKPLAGPLCSVVVVIVVVVVVGEGRGGR